MISLAMLALKRFYVLPFYVYSCPDHVYCVQITYTFVQFEILLVCKLCKDTVVTHIWSRTKVLLLLLTHTHTHTHTHTQTHTHKYTHTNTDTHKHTHTHTNTHKYSNTSMICTYRRAFNAHTCIQRTLLRMLMHYLCVVGVCRSAKTHGRTYTGRRTRLLLP